MMVASVLLMAIVFIIGVYLQFILIEIKDDDFTRNSENINTYINSNSEHGENSPISLMKDIWFNDQGLRILFLPRLVIPILLSILVVIGMPLYGFIGLLDPNSDINFFTFIYIAFKGIVFSIVLILKSFFSIFLFTISLITFIYFLFEHGDIKILLILEGFFSWVFSGTPKWISTAYAVIVIIYSLFSSIHAFTFEDLS